MSNFKSKLIKANQIFEDMTLLINICKKKDTWNVLWDDFWDLSREFPFDVDWCDMDMSYEDDIMDRYLAIERFMEGLE